MNTFIIFLQFFLDCALNVPSKTPKRHRKTSVFLAWLYIHVHNSSTHRKPNIEFTYSLMNKDYFFCNTTWFYSLYTSLCQPVFQYKFQDFILTFKTELSFIRITSQDFKFGLNTTTFKLQKLCRDECLFSRVTIYFTEIHWQ